MTPSFNDASDLDNLSGIFPIPPSTGAHSSPLQILGNPSIGTGQQSSIVKPPEKRARETFFVTSLGDLEIIEHDDGFDGNPAPPVKFAIHKWEFLNDVIQSEARASPSLPQDAYMTSADEMNWANPDAPHFGVLLSRAKHKALNREIPWREILQRGARDIKAFVGAVNTKWQNWCNFDPIEPLDFLFHQNAYTCAGNEKPTIGPSGGEKKGWKGGVRAH